MEATAARSNNRLFPTRLVFALSTVLPPGQALAQSGPVQRWEINATDHFDVYYRSEQRGNIDAFAREAERAYARLSIDLRHNLAEKTHLGRQKQQWPTYVLPTDRGNMTPADVLAAPAGVERDAAIDR